MKFGITMFPTDYAIDAPTLARAVEERGFDALFFPEHTHIPTSRRTPWPGGAELPREYSHTLDPFVATGAAAAVTKDLLLGTGICLVIQRDPITLAKEVASVDFLSGGRFLFGIGGGWNVEEMEDHGTAPGRRWKVLRERIEAMKEIWTKEEAEYHGEFVDFPATWSWPKPVHKPYPPILVGGDGANTLKRVIAYGDEWMPIPLRGPGHLQERMQELNQMAEAAGRGPIPVTCFGVPPKAEVLGSFEKIGVKRCVFFLPPVVEADALPLLDRYAGVCGAFASAGT